MPNFKKQLRLAGSVFVILAGVWLYYQSQVVTLPQLPPSPNIKIPVLKTRIQANQAKTPNGTTLSPGVREKTASPEIQGTTLSPEVQEEVSSPEITAPIALVYAPRSQTTLFEKNPDLPWAPASTTKLVTALVVLNNYSLDTIITVDTGDLLPSERAVFMVGEELVVKDLLEAMLVSSSNQAAYILANHAPGGFDQFIKEMNRFAAQHDLTTAHFENPAGFDAPGQQMTALDLIKLAKIVMANQDLKNIVSLTEVDIADFNSTNHHSFHTTNKLLLEEVEVIGIKTGTTDKAGQVLLSQFKLDDEDLVVVVMGSKDRYQDTKTIVNWVLESYDWLSADELEKLVEI